MPRADTLIVELRRIRDHGRSARITLLFEFEGGQPKSSRARYSHVDPEHMLLDGAEGWFETAKVGAARSAFWQAMRQVKPRWDR